MRYVTDCPEGKCYLEPDQVEISRTISAKGYDTKRKVCKLHGGRVIARLVKCEDCGKDFEAYKYGKLSTHCPDCQDKKSKAVIKKRNRDRYLPKNLINFPKRNEKLADPEKGNCVHRLGCCALWDGYNAVPCLYCGWYVKENYVPSAYHETTRQFGNTTMNSAF